MQLHGTLRYLRILSGVVIKTRQLFPAHFPDKGPDLDIRGAIPFTDFDKVYSGLLKKKSLNYWYVEFCIHVTE